jgi:phosphate uptake regulator
MQRSLIQLSPSTAVVSLPAPWIARNKLRKGAKLTVEEKENQLIISAQTKKSAREITLDISKLEKRLVWMAIDAAYIMGYDVIRVQTRDREQTELMTTVVRHHPGMIIDEERNNFVQFTDIAQESSTDLEKVLNRVFNCIAAVFDDAAAALQQKDWKMLCDMKRRDYTVNMYLALFNRQLNRYGYTPFSKIGAMHTYTKVIEMFSDKLMHLLRIMGEREASGKREQRLLSDVAALFGEIRKLRSSFTQEALIATEEHRKKVSLAGIDTGVAVYATEIVELIYEIEELEYALHL